MRGRQGQADMPDGIRATCGSIHARPQRRGFLAVSLSILPILLAGDRARAAEIDDSLVAAYADAFHSLGRHEVFGLALTLGILFFAVVTAGWVPVWIAYCSAGRPNASQPIGWSTSQPFARR